MQEGISVKVRVEKLEQMSDKTMADYRKSSKICPKPFTFETKETIVVRESGDLFRDRTKSSINQEVPRRDF